MKNLFFFGSLLFLILSSCQEVPESPKTSTFKIETGYGPEDIEVDTLNLEPRLIISCSSRRPEQGFYGEIEMLEIKTDARKLFVRNNEPSNLKLRPHGIYLYQSPKFGQLLFVVHHNDSLNFHPIIKYRVLGDSLQFVELFENKLLNSPNDLVVVNDSTFLVANDGSDRSSKLDKMLGLKTGSIIGYQSGNWQIVADELGMPAGIGLKGNTVLVSAATENIIYAFDYIQNKLENKREFAKINGPDNISTYSDYFIVASHFKPWQFIRHISSAKNLSSGVIYKVDLKTGKSEVLFSNKGDIISANSVAVEYVNDIFIGQVFENWVVEVK